MTLNDTADMYSEILKKTGCSSRSSSAKELDCLRQLPFDKLNSSVAETSWSPVVDGEFIPMAPSQQVNEGTFVKVPLLIGANVSALPSSRLHRLPLTDPGLSLFRLTKELLSDLEDSTTLKISSPLTLLDTLTC